MIVLRDYTEEQLDKEKEHSLKVLNQLAGSESSAIQTPLKQIF